MFETRKPPIAVIEVPRGLLIEVGARGADQHEVPLPRGAWPLDDGRWVSPRSFAETLRYYRRELGRLNLSFLVLPERMLDLQRVVDILPVAGSASWRSIQIVLAAGRTTIYILPPIPPSGQSDRLKIARGSSNGRTQDSDSCYLGSNPSPRTDAEPEPTEDEPGSEPDVEAA
jgi:hypothetical protein